MSRFFGGLFTKRPKIPGADLSQLGRCYTMAMGDEGEADHPV